jgi:hypothetical protein
MSALPQPPSIQAATAMMRCVAANLIHPETGQPPS